MGLALHPYFKGGTPQISRGELAEEMITVLERERTLFKRGPGEGQVCVQNVPNASGQSKERMKEQLPLDLNTGNGECLACSLFKYVVILEL